MAPVFNELEIVGTGPRNGLEDGQIKFRYDGYRVPSGSIQTIVKVLPVENGRVPIVVPMFVRFVDDGFIVRLIDPRGVPLPQAVLDLSMLMVEVSEFGKLVLQ